MIKTWQERLSSEMPLSTAMQDEIDELRTKLAAAETSANELRRAVAEVIGADPETWPKHGNAPLAIAACVASQKMKLAALKAQEPVAWINAYGESPMLSMCAPDDDRGTVAAHWRPLYLAAGAEPVKSEPTWDEALRISELPDIDEALRSLIEDGTEDNAVCLVRMVIAAGAAKVPEGWRSAVAMAYGHLWHVNNEPMAPIPLRSEESASYAARKLLRDLMTTKERGEAINSVRAMLAAALKEPS